jgi:hypothetical protein
LGINATYSVVALKAGDGWNAFRGEASPVVIAVEGERMDVAFGTPPQESARGNEILLPVLMNEPQAPEGSSQPDAKDEKKQDKEEQKQDKDKEEKENKKPEKWNSVDWGSLEWGDVDWQNFDWEKVDWEHLDWGAFGWITFGRDGEEQAEAVRAFVEDVKQCKDRGWETLGFNDAGDCVAYYVQEHMPTDLNWNDLDWGRSWNRGDGNDWRSGRNRWDHRGDD